MGLLDFITGNNQQNNNQGTNQNQGQQKSTQFSPITNYSAGNQNPQNQSNNQNPNNSNFGNMNTNQQGQMNPFGGATQSQSPSPYIQSQNNPPTYVESDIHQGAKTVDPTNGDSDNTELTNSTNVFEPQINKPEIISNSLNDFNNIQANNSNVATQFANPNPAMTPPLADDPVNKTVQNNFNGINNDPSMDELEKTLTQAPQTDEINNYAKPVEADQSNSIEAILNSSSNSKENTEIEPESTENSLNNILNSPTNNGVAIQNDSSLQPQTEEVVNEVKLNEDTQTEKSAIDSGSIDTSKDEVKIGLNNPVQSTEDSNTNSELVETSLPTQSKTTPTASDSVDGSLDDVTKKFINTDFSNLNLGNVGASATNETMPETSTENSVSVENAANSESTIEDSTNNIQPKQEVNSLPSVGAATVSGLTSASLASQLAKPSEMQDTNEDNIEKSQNTIEENINTSVNLDNTIFKKIGLIGLNGSKTDTSLSNHVRRISKKLATENVELLIDSRKGLGEFVIQGVNDANKKFTGVYLKPFMSVEAETPKQYIEETQGTSVLYSNYLERLKHLVKESRLFVFFNGGGIQNLSALSTVWSIANMYKGQNKPIILFGDSWENTLKTMQNEFGLSKSDLDTVVIVKSADELLQKISELSTTYSSNKSVSVERVVDRRVEGDEKDFIIY